MYLPVSVTHTMIVSYSPPEAKSYQLICFTALSGKLFNMNSFVDKGPVSTLVEEDISHLKLDICLSCKIIVLLTPPLTLLPLEMLSQQCYQYTSLFSFVDGMDSATQRSTCTS